MLEIVAAERAELLCEALLDDLERERAGTDPTLALLAPPVVLAPSREAEVLLWRRLAERRGGVIDLRCLSPGAFLRQVARDAPTPVTLIDRPLIERWLQHLLLRGTHDPALLPEPIARYLERPGGGARAAALAGRLAAALDDALAQELLPARFPDAEPEWLRDLLARALGPDGVATQLEPGARALPLCQALDVLELDRLTLPPVLRGHCLPPLPPAQQRAFAWLATRIDVRLFVQDPGGEEPVRDDGATAGGLPGRIRARWSEAIRLTRTTLADRHGARVRRLPAAAEAPAGMGAPPTALIILRAPSRRRELEAIAARIWREVERGRDATPPLRLSDVAVILPPSALTGWGPELAAVFGEADLPFRLVGAPLAGVSPSAEALRALCELPGGACTREEILSFLLREPVLAAAGVTDPESWVALCEELGVVRGSAADDLRDTYLASDDRVSWEHGLGRLALGRFVDGPKAGDDRPVLARGRPVLPLDLPATLPGSTLAFARVVRRVLDLVRALRAASMPLREWASHLAAAAEGLLLGVDAADQRALDLCLARLRALAALPWPEPVRHGLAAALITHELAEPSTTLRREAGAEGVLVSTLAPARGRGFRCAFLAGLDAGAFPGHDRPGELALGAPSAPTPPSARSLDQACFAELLWNARDGIYLSYLARHESTGEPMEPSSLVRECALAWPDGCVFEEIPLARDEDALARTYLDGAAREQHARAAGRAARAALALPADPASLRAKAPEPVRARLATVLGPVLAPGPAAGPDGTRLSPRPASLRLRDLLGFLSCPLQGSARLRLGLFAQDDDESEALQVGDEPIVPSADLARRLPREALGLAIRRAAERGRKVPDDALLDEAWQDRARLAHLSGRLPAGVFGAAFQEQQRALLRAWRDRLEQLAERLEGAPRVLTFGGDPPGGRSDARLPALALPASPRPEAGTHALGGPIELRHETGLLLSFKDGGRGTLVLRVRTSSEGKVQPADVLRAGLPALADLLACALGPEPPTRFEIALALPADSEPHCRELPVPAPAAARAYLRALLDEALFEPHDYLLPMEAVFDRCTKATPMPRVVASLLDAPVRGNSSRHGPVPDIEGYLPPDDALALEIIQRRFSVYLGDLTPPALAPPEGPAARPARGRRAR